MGELAKRFGRQVRALRRARGLTQVQLADAAGLSEEWVRRVERGEGTPSLDAVEAFSSVLDAPIPDLFGASLSAEQERMAGIHKLTGKLSDEELAWVEDVLKAMLGPKRTRRAGARSVEKPGGAGKE
jgi:transcriptional regulator with XRE-family HTH domain